MSASSIFLAAQLQLNYLIFLSLVSLRCEAWSHRVLGMNCFLVVKDALPHWLVHTGWLVVAACWLFAYLSRVLKFPWLVTAELAVS